VKTSGSFFTGGALFDVGAQAAGYKVIWGIEKDDKIASVARLNGFPVRKADVISLDLATLERPDHFHASPPCPSFSVANNKKGETELDIAMADVICRALVHFKPDTFTLENVVGYRNSESFKRISNTLTELGYWWDATNLNSADFGVPQTRIRLWVRACRGLLRGYPHPVPWKGWYQAIEDLIPSLPDAEFAPWQLSRLPEEYRTLITRPAKYGPEERGRAYREGNEPSPTVLTYNTVQRAFVLDGQANEGERMTVRDEQEPIFTQSASSAKRPARAHVGGRVVKLDIRCLGRFQTVPDWYQGLTVKINGNGVPCLMAQRVLETL